MYYGGMILFYANVLVLCDSKSRILFSFNPMDFVCISEILHKMTAKKAKIKIRNDCSPKMQPDSFVDFGQKKKG